jgi:hypothetical protein
MQKIVLLFSLRFAIFRYESLVLKYENKTCSSKAGNELASGVLKAETKDQDKDRTDGR